MKRLKRDTESGLPAAVLPLPRAQHRALMLAGVLILIGIAGTVAWFASRQQQPPPPELRERRLTANPADNPVTSALISPDGKYLAYSDLGGIRLQLIATGETRTIPHTEGWTLTSWFPDGSKLLANGPNAKNPGIWVISAMGGTPRQLQDNGSTGLVSPDGSQIAFANRVDTYLGGFQELWIMGPSGGELRKILTAKADWILLAAWSPEGSRVAYLRAGLFSPMSGMVPSTLESIDLKTGKVTTLLSGVQLGGASWSPPAFWWCPDGRIIYSRPEPRARTDANLWELRVNTNTGEPAGKPGKITHWSGTAVGSANAGADGRRLAVLKVNFQHDVYIGQLEANGARIKAPRRLTLDERDDAPGPWMPDSKTEIFSSDRNGNWDIFKQAIDQTSAEPLVTGQDDEFAKGITPDGLWLLYTVRKQGDASAPERLMRMPISGGSPELLLDAGVGINDIACAKRPPSTLCIVSKHDPEGMVFSAFDLATRQSRELPKFEKVDDWDFFHDGSRIALLSNEQGESRVRIVRSSGEMEREFIVERPGIWHIYCSVDGKGLYLAAAPEPGVATLYYTDLRGQSRVLWQQKGRRGGFGALWPSPDGRYLAMVGTTTTSDAWLLENF